MQETGKYNKRNADYIRAELIRLKRIESKEGQLKASGRNTEESQEFSVASGKQNSIDD